MAQSTGTTTGPSPMITTSHNPAMPVSTRFCWPLHHRPTTSSCCPYFLHTESSMAHGHCQRLCVAGLFASTWRQRGTKTSHPQRRRRLIQERLGRAPRMREGQCLSQSRTRQSSEGVRHPKSTGNITPTILPRSFCWLRRRPSISTTTRSGRPHASSAWWRASAARCAWRWSRSKRSGALWRRRVLAFACFLAYRLLGDIACSFRPLGSQGTVRRKLCLLRG